MKKQTIKVTGSLLMGLISEAVNEYRSETGDGDRSYIRPDGSSSISNSDRDWMSDKIHINPEISNYIGRDKEIGKRSNDNFNGRKFHDNVPHFSGPLSNGKAAIIFKEFGMADIVNNMDKISADGIIKNNPEVEWTDSEKKKLLEIKSLLNELHSKLYDLAKLTKEEGNEKRGYNGPKKGESQKEDEQLSESKKGSKTMMTESQLVNHIYEKVKNRLSEAVDDPGYMLNDGWSKTIDLEPMVEYSDPMLDREIFQELVSSGLAQEEDADDDYSINGAIYQFMDEKFMPRLQAVYNKSAGNYGSTIDHDTINNQSNLKVWKLYVSRDRYSDDIVEFFIKHLLNSINTVSQEGGPYAVAGKMAKQAVEESISNELYEEFD